MRERIEADESAKDSPAGHTTARLNPTTFGLVGSAGNAATSRLLQPLSGAPAGLPTLRAPLPASPELGGVVAALTGRSIGRLAEDRPAGGDVHERGQQLQASWSELGPGRPLTAAERGPSEQSYGFDLSGVRAHEGRAATQVADALGAHALTLGRDIIVGSSAPSPTTWAHELAHVVQQRDATALGGLRGANPNGAGESDARSAAEAVLAGRLYDPAAAASQEYQAIPVPLLLFLIGVAVAGAYGAYESAAGPSYEQNQQERAADADHWANSPYLSLVPGVGSLVHVRYAEGSFERWFSVLCFGMDIMTLGMAGSAFVKTTGLWRTAGATITRAESEQLASAGVRAVSQDVRNETLRTALEFRRPVAVFRGGSNHAEVWVRVGENTVRRLHGGPMARIFAENSSGFGRRAASERMTQIVGDEALDRMIGGVNAYSVLDVPGAQAAVLSEADRIATQGLGWTARSCGVTQSQLVSAIPGLEAIVPASRSAQFLPIQVMGQMSEQGALRLVAGRSTQMWLNGQLVLAAAPTTLGHVMQAALTSAQNEFRTPATAAGTDSETMTVDQFLASVDAGSGGPTVDLRSVPTLLDQMSNPEADHTPAASGLTSATEAMMVLTVPPPPGVVEGGAPPLSPAVERTVDEIAEQVRPPHSNEHRDRVVANVTERFPMSLPPSSVELIRGRLRTDGVDGPTADAIAAKLLLNH